MKAGLFALTLLVLPLAVSAETLVAARTVRAKSVLTAEDLATRPVEVYGGLTNMADVIGKEAKVTLYAGRPIRAGDISNPAIVERNQIITLVHQSGGMTISAAARSLGRGGPGDPIRVMNLTSRTIVNGHIRPDGKVGVPR